jgi:hypothetical protein
MHRLVSCYNRNRGVTVRVRPNSKAGPWGANPKNQVVVRSVDSEKFKHTPPLLFGIDNQCHMVAQAAWRPWHARP